LFVIQVMINSQIKNIAFFIAMRVSISAKIARYFGYWWVVLISLKKLVIHMSYKVKNYNF
ncbi:TPA: hypothetical protein ACGDSX_003804, partial [Acinetobacter baumannii]